MYVVHGDSRVLASDVRVAESLLETTRGLMFRRSIPDDFALVFRFDRATARTVHMLFVPFPIDVLWVRDGRVQQRNQLAAWIGLGRARADTIVELPAGAADNVDPGDRVRVDRDEDRSRDGGPDKNG